MCFVPVLLRARPCRTPSLHASLVSLPASDTWVVNSDLHFGPDCLKFHVGRGADGWETQLPLRLRHVPQRVYRKPRPRSGRRDFRCPSPRVAPPPRVAPGTEDKPSSCLFPGRDGRPALQLEVQFDLWAIRRQCTGSEVPDKVLSEARTLEELPRGDVY